MAASGIRESRYIAASDHSLLVRFSGEIARAIATLAAHWSHDVVLVGLAGSAMLDAFQESGFPVAAEAFADRRYERHGSLRSRQLDGALIADPAEAA
jgi:5-oxoprolinase (ATP-hydrolysing) subunit A